MFLVWLPVLLFFEVEEDTGKGQKQVRNRSETPKRQHLPSIQPFTFVFFASILLKIRYGLDQIYYIYKYIIFVYDWDQNQANNWHGRADSARCAESAQMFSGQKDMLVSLEERKCNKGKVKSLHCLVCSCHLRSSKLTRMSFWPENGRADSALRAESARPCQLLAWFLSQS